MTLNSSLHLVGLTGRNASGKGEAAKFFEKQGYAYLSLSDTLREVALEQGIEPSRVNLIQLGTVLRESEGPDVLAKRTLAKLISGKYVVDSIRNPHEILYLKKAAPFILVCIDAPASVRFERAMNRGRNENVQTLDEFIALENQETSANSKAQQLDKCIELCDETVSNDSTLVHLQQNLQILIENHSFFKNS